MRCGSSPLPSAFLSFALWRGAVQCVCTVTALPPGSISVRAHRWKHISKRAAKPCGLCLLLRKKLSIDTASVCVDFALLLCLLAFGNLLLGQRAKLLSLEHELTHSDGQRALCWEHSIRARWLFSQLPISHEFPAVIKVFALQILQSHYSGN